jgi:hypothetical protein
LAASPGKVTLTGSVDTSHERDVANDEQRDSID